jgi:Lon protease-like protein
MKELPLFPLNTVVFPGWPMPLNIFESRYKEMIEYCVAQKQPFGIVLIEEGSAEFDTAVRPHQVGCVVEITKVQQVEDGRLYILAVGQERFRIRKLKRDKPYLVGEVESMEFLEEEAGVLDTAVFNLRPRVIQ